MITETKIKFILCRLFYKKTSNWVILHEKVKCINSSILALFIDYCILHSRTQMFYLQRNFHPCSGVKGTILTLLGTLFIRESIILAVSLRECEILMLTKGRKISPVFINVSLTNVQYCPDTKFPSLPRTSKARIGRPAGKPHWILSQVWMFVIIKILLKK